MCTLPSNDMGRSRVNGPRLLLRRFLCARHAPHIRTCSEAESRHLRDSGISWQTLDFSSIRDDRPLTQEARVIFLLVLSSRSNSQLRTPKVLTRVARCRLSETSALGSCCSYRRSSQTHYHLTRSAYQREASSDAVTMARRPVARVQAT